MIELIWDEGFKRAYKKKVKYNRELKGRFWEAIKLFLQNPFHPRLRTHKLSGYLKDLWAFSISYEWRVIFKFIGKHQVLLIDIGTHEEVY